MALTLNASYDILKPKKSGIFVCITSLIWKNPTKLKDNEMGEKIPAIVVRVQCVSVDLNWTDVSQMTYGTFVFFFLQTRGKYDFTLTEYESYSDFEHNITGTAISKSSFSLGFKIPGIFELGYSSMSNIGQHFISRIKRFSHTVGTLCLLFHSYVFIWIFISTDVCILCYY